MGASESKPAPSLGTYQWKASGPPSLSSPVLDSIQSSPETDASRAKQIEKQIQSRVSEELKKAQNRQSEALAAAKDKISAAADRLVPDGAEKKKIDSEALAKEVDAMRKHLDSRKQVRDLPESVEKARNDVVKCLRENDRRPLDCWQEVETFKAEVKKLEKTWVDKVIA